MRQQEPQKMKNKETIVSWMIMLILTNTCFAQLKDCKIPILISEIPNLILPTHNECKVIVNECDTISYLLDDCYGNGKLTLQTKIGTVVAGGLYHSDSIPRTLEIEIQQSIPPYNWITCDTLVYIPIRSGRWYYYFRNGELKREEFYDQGKRAGQWTEYYINGQIKIDALFRNDTLMSINSWNTNSNKMVVNGTGKHIGSFDMLFINCLEISFKDSKIDGRVIIGDSYDKIASIKNYKEGIFINEEIFFNNMD